MYWVPGMAGVELLREIAAELLEAFTLDMIANLRHESWEPSHFPCDHDLPSFKSFMRSNSAITSSFLQAKGVRGHSVHDVAHQEATNASSALFSKATKKVCCSWFVHALRVFCVGGCCKFNMKTPKWPLIQEIDGETIYPGLQGVILQSFFVEGKGVEIPGVVTPGLTRV